MAFGKFLLLGEHSILYGGQAIAFPLKDATLVTTFDAPNNGPLLNGSPLEGWKKEKIEKVFEVMKLPGSPKQLSIQSEIPLGKGLGSSAALCVELARHFFPNEKTLQTAERALQGESVFHGTPSGVDPWVISVEQPIVFRMARREYRPLNLKNCQGYVFLLRDSGSEHQTDAVLASVKRLQTSDPDYFVQSMERLRTNTALGLKLLEAGEMDRLGMLLQDSNRLLLEMKLGSPGIENAIESLLKQGALGAKLTGAGCGGYVLGLFPENKFPKHLQAGDIIVPCS